MAKPTKIQRTKTRLPYFVVLADLHRAAPGILDVIFGPDGVPSDAPAFLPPLWDGQRWVRDYRVEDLHTSPLILRLDVSTIAGRVAGLCAQACVQHMGLGRRDGQLGRQVVVAHYWWAPRSFGLTVCFDGPFREMELYWEGATGSAMPVAGVQAAHDPPDFDPEDMRAIGAWGGLADLIFALADKIAALGSLR